MAVTTFRDWGPLWVGGQRVLSGLDPDSARPCTSPFTWVDSKSLSLSGDQAYVKLQDAGFIPKGMQIM